ncbi:histidine kinase [Dactylosporangium sp. McL0621]|uniref:sensor histidine kinase n=1 Tax=Dactylosporangium sp. McL0621 TaxID=3415678 RepID=UPI003CF08BEA
MLVRLAARLLPPTPPLWLGIAVGVLLVAAEMLLVDLLRHVVARDALEVFFLLGVLAISTIWGVRLALAMSVVSVAAYNIGYVPPVRDLDVSKTRDWVELAAFLVAMVLASVMAELARVRAVEAVQRRQEADLFAGLARHCLAVHDLRLVLPEASHRLARMLRLPFAAIERDSVPGDEDRMALPLRYGSQTGTLFVPADLQDPVLRRVRERMVPQLEILLQAATEREAMADSLHELAASLRELAAEQASLRRVAVLVAHLAPPADVVAAVAAETASLLAADATRLMRQEAPGTVSVIAEYSQPGVEPLLGRQFTVGGGITELVLRTARPARMDSYDDRSGPLADLARKEGFRSSVATPITVEDRVWGALVVLWTRGEPAPPNTEQRLAQFAELVGTAIANTESRAELNTSRTRIVLAADEARRRIERDLHDGVQQRLVSLGLELRAAEALLPGDPDQAKAQLGRTTEGLGNAFNDLQEISRGLHPAILSQGGLMTALKALARRAPVPVTINHGPKRRLPSGVEVAAYYVVSEALTNAAKHAGASEVDVDVDITLDDHTGREVLVLSIRDDGVGGADPALGSGLVGLADRVEALGGHLQVSSPARSGTTVLATLPIDIDFAPTD